MNTFYIVRHGETENNRTKRLSGWIDSPLTEKGLEPTATVIKRLQNIPFAGVHASDLGRAFITAYIICRALNYTDEITREPGLREVNYGDAANMFSAEAYAKYPQIDRDTDYAPPNGESLAHMQSRVFATVADINERYRDSNILLVCHSGVMAALKSAHIGQDFGEHNISEGYPHDFVGVFTFADNTVQSFKPLELL